MPWDVWLGAKVLEYGVTAPCLWLVKIMNNEFIMALERLISVVCGTISSVLLSLIWKGVASMNQAR